jgi:hypothetical protein
LQTLIDIQVVIALAFTELLQAMGLLFELSL